MAEEQKQDQYSEVPKGFISLKQPFISTFEKNEQQKHFITTDNYQQFMEGASKSEEGFNSQGVPNYEFSFYEIQDSDFPSELIPEIIVSSDQNEISPLEWNQYSSCVKVGKNKYIITGGVKQDSEYSNIFYSKAHLIVELKQQVHLLEELVQEYNRVVENESEKDRTQRLFYFTETAHNIKQTEVNLALAEDIQESHELSYKILTNEIPKLKFRLEQKIVKLDKDFCKKKNFVYGYKENQPEGTTFFSQDYPYSPSTVEVTFDYNQELKKYEFTGKYLEDMPQSISNHQSILHKGKVYVIGGVSNQVLSSSVYAYDLLSNTWSTVAPLSTPRVNFTAVSHGDFIYVFGGQTKNFKPINPTKGEVDTEKSTVSYLERLNPESGAEEWSKVNQKKKLGSAYSFQVHQQLKLLSIGDKLVLIGGNSKQQVASQEKVKVQIARLDLQNDNFTINPYDTELSIRKGETISKGTYSGREVYYIFGGVPYPLLECVAIDSKDKQLEIEKILDNDYSEDFEQSYNDHIFIQPTLYIE